MSKFGKGASFFRVRQDLQNLNPALAVEQHADNMNDVPQVSFQVLLTKNNNSQFVGGVPPDTMTCGSEAV